MALTWGTHSQRPGVIPLTLVVKSEPGPNVACWGLRSQWWGQVGQDQHYGDQDPQRWWYVGVILFLKFWENCIWCVPKLTFWVHWFQNYFGFCSMTLPSHVSHFCQRVLVLYHNGHTAPKFNWVITFMTFIIPQNRGLSSSNVAATWSKKAVERRCFRFWGQFLYFFLAGLWIYNQLHCMSGRRQKKVCKI